MTSLIVSYFFHLVPSFKIFFFWTIDHFDDFESLYTCEKFEFIQSNGTGATTMEPSAGSKRERVWLFMFNFIFY